MPEEGIECESFTVISFTVIDYLLVYENKYDLHVYLDNCAYRISVKQIRDYLDDSLFEDWWRLGHINAVSRKNWYKQKNWTCWK